MKLVAVNLKSLVGALAIVLISIPFVAETNTELSTQIMLYMSFTVVWALYFPVVEVIEVKDKDMED